MAAWRGFEKFEGRAPLRAWLYRMAASRLNAWREAGRGSVGQRPAGAFTLPAPIRLGEPLWLEPYPDALLDGLPEEAPGPEPRYEMTESISLAFVAALQHLPPTLRATLVLRDVIGFPAAEVADILDRSESTVTSDLRQARTTLTVHLRTSESERPPLPGSPCERDLVARFVAAFERGDIEGIATLLTDGVWLTTPPLPFEYQGRAAAARVLSAIVFRGGTREFRLVATRANAQPAFGCYLKDLQAPIARASGLIVLTLAGDRISGLTRFVDNNVLLHFGLPPTLYE